MNNTDNNRFHSRKNPRLDGYDYSKPNYYFVTVCTWEKKCIFWDGENRNSYGRIAERGLMAIKDHFSNVKVDKYVVMPNHIHAIFVLEKNSPNLSVVIGQYKSFVTREIHLTEPNKKVWQASYHDHIVRDQKGYEKIWLYIDSNPANWKKDCFFTENQ